MTYYPPVNQNYQPEPEAGGKGLAIASLICGGIGILFFPLALIGLVLGIIALAQSSGGGRGPARGLAIAGTAVSGCTLALGCVIGIAIFLPALGKARQAAQQLKSSTQLRTIGTGFMTYASSYKDQLPPKNTDWQKLLQDNAGIVPAMFDSPAAAAPGSVSYLYVPPGTTIAKIKTPATTVLAFEDPTNFRNRGTNVLFVDGHVEWQIPPNVWSTLEGLKLSDGTVYHKPANAP